MLRNLTRRALRPLLLLVPFFLILVLVKCGGGGGGSGGGAAPAGKVVAGRVLDKAGKPVRGAQVKLLDAGPRNKARSKALLGARGVRRAASTPPAELGTGTTDGNGFYSIELTALPAAGDVCSVKCTAPGFTTGEDIVDNIANLLDDNPDNDTLSVEVDVKQVDAVVDQVIDAATANVDIPTPDGAATCNIANPAAVLGTTGNISFEISSGNPKVDFESFPGGFDAADANDPTGSVGLASIAFCEIKATNLDTGQEITSLNGEATLCMKIPDGTVNPVTNAPYVAGVDTIEVFDYDEGEGTWVRGVDSKGVPITATVSLVNGVLCATFNVPHFSYWNCDHAIEEHNCVSGNVVDIGGKPVAGAEITITGIGYTYLTHGVESDADGNFCGEVLKGYPVKVQARIGQRVSNIVTANVPDLVATCHLPQSATNICTPVGTLTLADATCISGIVKDQTGTPITGADVILLGAGTGGWFEDEFATTDANGKYCLNGVPMNPTEDLIVRATIGALFGEGGHVGDVPILKTDARLAVKGDCATHTCIDQDIVIDTTAVCVSGAVTRTGGAAVSGATVYTDKGQFAQTDSSGRYCFTADKGVTITVTAAFWDPLSGTYFTEFKTVTTGSTAGDCGTGTGCTTVPDFLIDTRVGCVNGTVQDEKGNPLQFVSVNVPGYPGGATNAAGNYCVAAPIDPAVTVDFNFYAPNGRFVTASQTVNVAVVAACGGACVAAANQTLDLGQACVSGTAQVGGQPTAGVYVISSTGVFESSDASGNFCIDVPKGQDVTLSFLYYIFTPTFQSVQDVRTVTAAQLTGISASCGGACFSLGAINLNSSPTVSAVSANPTAVMSRQTVALSATASDPNGDALTYTWDAADGTFTGTGANVTWTAPLVQFQTPFALSVSVTDGKGGVAAGGVVVTVDPAPNKAPVITAVTATPSSVLSGGQVSITVTGSDPDGDPVTFAWSASGGTVVGADSTVMWDAPAVAGTYTISVVVSDSIDSVTGSVDVVATQANRAPVLSAVTADAGVVSPGALVNLTANASDPDGDALTFTWSAAIGTLGGSTTANETWTAPQANGIYTIQVTVSDGKLSASGSVAVQVSGGTASGALRLTLLDEKTSNPASGVRVILHNADGTIAQTITTGANGLADFGVQAANAPIVTMIAAAPTCNGSGGTSLHMNSIFDIPPLDYVLGAPGSGSQCGTTLATFTLVVQGVPNGTTQIQFSTVQTPNAPTQNGSTWTYTGATLQDFNRLQSDGTFNLVATTQQPDPNNQFAMLSTSFGTVLDVLPATINGGTLNVTVGQALTGVGFTAASPVTFVNLSANRKKSDSQLGFFSAPFDPIAGVQTPASSGTFSSADLTLGVGDFYVQEGGAFSASGGSLERKKVGTTFPANLTLSPPAFSVGTITPTNSATNLTSVAWTVAGGTAADYDSVSVEIRGTLTVGAQAFSWELNLTNAAASVTLPTLPADLGAVGPITVNNGTTSIGVDFEDFDTAVGWADFIAKAQATGTFDFDSFLFYNVIKFAQKTGP